MSSRLAFVGTSVVSCLFGVPPASVPNLAAGLYHGVVQGTALFLLGALIAALLCALLVRGLLRGFILRKLRGTSYEQKFYALSGAVAKEGAYTITVLLRLSPAMPLPIGNVLLSLTDVGLLPYTVGSLIGLLPFTIVYAYVGSVGQAAASGSSDTLTLVGQGVGLLATIALTKKVSDVARKALDDAQKAAPTKRAV